MGWALGYDFNWQRDVGYGVPAVCDHPDCEEVINRGLGYVCCKEQVYGGDEGCGLFFCIKHRDIQGKCERCQDGKPPFQPKLDSIPWVKWKLTNDTWGQWRKANPDLVAELEARLERDDATSENKTADDEEMA
jgi:hypothetical protein